jgi:hypothetical protein
MTMMGSNIRRFQMVGAGWLISVLVVLGFVANALASSEGVEWARHWQRIADMGRANGQWDVAYTYYTLIARTFPDTPHGRLALARAKEAKSWLLYPKPASSDETPVSWVEELFDFLTWP